MFDQGGTLFEWTEWANHAVPGGMRGLRGGAWNYPIDPLHAAFRLSSRYPESNYYNVGFRVAVVPEPASLTLLVVGAMVAIRRKRRHTK